MLALLESSGPTLSHDFGLYSILEAILTPFHLSTAGFNDFSSFDGLDASGSIFINSSGDYSETPKHYTHLPMNFSTLNLLL